jgi:hypothetical protein
MRRAIQLIGFVLAIVFCTSAVASSSGEGGGLPPWRFGMTPQEVAAFPDYGPYKSFSNGDLETYAGRFDGRKENVQFFFKDGKLARIGIYLYEGRDVKEGAKAWTRAYTALKSMYGEIQLPDIQVTDGTALTPEMVGVAGGANTDAVGKSQMAPFKQPMDKRVFASFRRQSIQGQMVYYVIVYYDPPHAL